jgi:alpha-D-ribose 1-methylphosphonate 5-triphosphate synthase subunit PhnG
MDRNQRFEAIAVCDEAVLARLAERALAGGAAVTVLREPTPGMVMMRARESARRSLFNLGEVAVTEAEVEIGPHRGYAMTMGLRPAKALAGAIVDAAAEADPALRPTIEAALREATAADEAGRAARRRRIVGTRVRFDEIP